MYVANLFKSESYITRLQIVIQAYHNTQKQAEYC